MRKDALNIEVGTLYKKWKIIGVVVCDTNRQRGIYLCQCVDCGLTKEIYGRNLFYLHSPKCNCLLKRSRAFSYVGQRFGLLTVTGVDYDSVRQIYFCFCICDCGNQIRINNSSLVRRNKTKSCGCLRHKNSPKGKILDRKEAPAKVLWQKLIYKNKNRGFADTLNFTEFKDLIFSPCFYCGASSSVYLRDSWDTKGAFVLYYNTIDRIDSSRGYEVHNCVSCCKVCNTAKNTMTEAEFYSWVLKIYSNLVKKGKIE